MNKSSLLVVVALEIMFALAVVLFCLALVRWQRSSDRSIRETVASSYKAAKNPVRALLLIVAVIVVADFLLPPERIQSNSLHQQAMPNGAVKVLYALNCSGGEVDFCEVPRGLDLQQKQTILIKRSRIFDRCSIAPLPEPKAPIKCF
ncbi:hypothetical protein [Comamonas testosteroni]|uniref:hypothetical protein n=1 Tax=Comamonas testosteroni TaxID=285 RepID=UPI0026EBACD4|nr:hypothetical protein [Comamonas testosteroni]WQD45266.1 hypothetical protein U0024_11130 [Comamonas testosteroni]